MREYKYVGTSEDAGNAAAAVVVVVVVVDDVREMAGHRRTVAGYSVLSSKGLGLRKRNGCGVGTTVCQDRLLSLCLASPLAIFCTAASWLGNVEPFIFSRLGVENAKLMTETKRFMEQKKNQRRFTSTRYLHRYLDLARTT